MAIKQFKTESKRLLDLMTNSIYTNTDIFLRELISNASDALDKKHILSLQDTSIKEEDPCIIVEVNKKDRTITIKDNGVGMNKEDLDNNLGTIAKSGSFEFKNDMSEKDAQDIIGQFGVGFYSGFMVADKIEVISKKVNEDKAYSWVSENEEGYEIKAANKEDDGTTIILHVKENTKEKKYDKYLESYEIEQLIKKYSDFIRYPIKMEKTSTKKVDDKDVTETKLETINSMVPIWKKDKKSIKENDYNDFYMSTYYDFTNPLKTIHYKVEGNTSYTALLYIPSTRPFNYFSADYKLGLSLYSKGVFIKDEAKELCSEYYRFIRGVVDSDDLNLNISREILQQDHQMNQLKKSIDKKIKSTLVTMLEKNREDYDKFYDNFGVQFKYGIYQTYGAAKDELIDLIMFKSSKEDKYVTLKEYVASMKEGQTEIYYATGDSIEDIKKLPQIEKLLDKGYEVLYFTDSVDEFMITMLNEYDGKKFKSIQKGDINLETEEEKKELEKVTNDYKDLTAKIKEILKDKVSDVKVSNRLKTYPCCLVSDDNLSIEMEKILKSMNQDGVKANRILEINPDHELFKLLKNNFDNKKDINDYVTILYNQSLLQAGLTIDDSTNYYEVVNNLIQNNLKKDDK